MSGSADRVIGVVLLAVAVLYYRQTYAISTSFVDDPLGPTFFPRLLAILLALGSVGLIVAGGSRSKSRADAVPSSAGRLVSTIAVTSAYLLVLPGAGYVLATPVYLAAIAYLLGYRAWRPLVATAIGLTLAVMVLFGWMLGVRLPRGLLFP